MPATHSMNVRTSPPAAQSPAFRAEAIVGGVSGSPVLDQAGAAIGIVTNSSEDSDRRDGTAPQLVLSLPGQFLIDLVAIEKLKAARRAW